MAEKASGEKTTAEGAGLRESDITFLNWEKFSTCFIFSDENISNFHNFKIANYDNECNKVNFKVFDRNDVSNVNQLCSVINLLIVILAFIIAEFLDKGPQRTESSWMLCANY